MRNRGLFFTHHSRTLWTSTAPACSSELGLPGTIQILASHSDPASIAALSTHNREQSVCLKLKYPYILSRMFNGEIAYTHQNLAPEELIKNGGLKSIYSNLSYQVNTGNSMGGICLTMAGASVAGVFTRDDRSKRHFIYAIPLHGEHFLPGSNWGVEVMAPGALAQPDFWLAREIVDINNNGRMELGPLMGRLGKMPVIPGCALGEFCNERFLSLPKTINWGDDEPFEYVIPLTPDLARIDAKIKNYYQEQRVKLVDESRPALHL